MENANALCSLIQDLQQVQASIGLVLLPILTEMQRSIPFHVQ